MTFSYQDFAGVIYIVTLLALSRAIVLRKDCERNQEQCRLQQGSEFSRGKAEFSTLHAEISVLKVEIGAKIDALSTMVKGLELAEAERRGREKEQQEKRP